MNYYLIQINAESYWILGEEYRLPPKEFGRSYVVTSQQLTYAILAKCTYNQELICVKNIVTLSDMAILHLIRIFFKFNCVEI